MSMHYSPDVLDTIRYALEVFCVASGARINWDKSYGILAGLDDVPTWGPGDFTWLRPGETCRYLGFQVGLDVTFEQQFSLVMQSMRRKLCYWSSLHLSLAGRALVANQVLLASTWYVASCWTFNGGVMLQLKLLIRNFLFGGSYGTHDTRVRVSWSTVIMLTSEGGLGIIDREMQSRALLTKLIVRGLFPGNEPWKMLLQSGLATVTLTYGVRDGHMWTSGMRFLFMDAPGEGFLRVQWRDRSQEFPEDDILIFPYEANFVKVQQSGGRVYLLKFKHDDRKNFFWMQEPNEKQDLGICTTVDYFLNCHSQESDEEEEEQVDIAEPSPETTQILESR
ncbi:hypothetical protein L7F22_034168 [Adiantum nelumboides]|nr:hypothetical protein [Adiantum nelumboides]